MRFCIKLLRFLARRRKMNDKEYAAAIVPLAEKALQSCMDAAAKLKFDKKHAQHLCVVCLYGSVVELAHETVQLTKLNRGSGVPVLLRAALEAFAKLRCCIVDPQHVGVLTADFTEEKLRPLKAALRAPDNEFLVSLATEFDLRGEIGRLQAELDALEADGIESMTAADEFQKANMEKEYRSMYWMLCLDAHSALSTLQDRHLRIEAGDYEVQWFKEPEPRDVIRDIDSLCGLLVHATYDVHKFLDTEALGDVEILKGDLAALRAQHFPLAAARGIAPAAPAP
jgi:hypothetical protein